MLKKVKFSFADKRSLAAKSIEATPIGVDLSKMVVSKPWGYEYLLTETPLVEVWHLSLEHLKSTSTHCHPNKKTALIVLEGRALFSTLNNEIRLKPLDAIAIDAGVFHSTKCVSKKGLSLIEIETPPMKHDLVRLKDKYGRANMGYEGKEKMKLINSSYVKFKSEKTSAVKKIGDKHLRISFIQGIEDLNKLIFQKVKVAVILNGFIKSQQNKILYQVGDVLETKILKNKNLKFNNVSLFSISKT